MLLQFEKLCKNPELASEVACGPVNDFDFDISILFSDILFLLEGLGLPLHFNPGPIFGDFITKDNLSEYSNIDKAIEHMEFQRKAIEITREQLPNSKSLIGFVGGPWTLLRFATNKKKNLNTEVKKILITTGGTGGHVIPAQIIKEHLKENFEIYYSTDIRGFKYLSSDTDKTVIINSPQLNLNFYWIV